MSRRPGLLGLALWACHGVMAAAGAAETCLGAGDVQEAVARGKVIEPRAALSTARQLSPGAEVMRGGLCRQGEALIYQILILRKDGRMAHVTIDGSSGKVMRVNPP